jgi:hypothetical protein
MVMAARDTGDVVREATEPVAVLGGHVVTPQEWG